MAIIANVSLLCSLLAGDANAQDRAIINNRQSPYSKLRSVDLSDVRWTEGFWKQKFDLVKDVTISRM